MHRGQRQAEAGFSLVEMMVAMVVTLIITSAIYGLMTVGQNAFRREPEVADRQQNIRVAMDAIKRDVAGAGAGMVPFVQAFTNGLNGMGNTNPSSTQTAGAMVAGQETDVLEILTSDGQCRPALLSAAPAAAGPLLSNEALPKCFPDLAATAPSFFYVGGTTPTDRNSYGVVMGKANVAYLATGVAPFQIDLIAPTVARLNPAPAGFCSTSCTVLAPIDVVRYEIARDPNDITVPCLWRSRTGQFNSAGAVAAPPNGNWEMVARGIEDLQVQYLTGTGAGTWNDIPGLAACTGCNPVVNADFTRVVRQVRITLSARTTEANLQGMSREAGSEASAGTAIRGQLVAVVSPRAALVARTLAVPAVTDSWF